MANNVYSYVKFHRIDDAGKEVLAQLFSRIDEEKNFFKIFNVPDDQIDMDFMREHVGSKWCYLDDWDEDTFSLVSAWSCPMVGIDFIFNKVGEVCPDFIASVTYEDEGLNFYGAYVSQSDGVYDSMEQDFEEIIDFMIKEYPELEPKWNNETQEFIEDGYETFCYHVFDHLNEIEEKFIKNCVSELMEE